MDRDSEAGPTIAGPAYDDCGPIYPRMLPSAEIHHSWAPSPFQNSLLVSVRGKWMEPDRKGRGAWASFRPAGAPR